MKRLFYDHFRCRTSASAAETWSGIRAGVRSPAEAERLQNASHSEERWAQYIPPENRLIGAFDQREKLFRLRYGAPHSNRNLLSRGMEVTISLTPQESGCYADVEIRLPTITKLFLAAWFGFVLCMMLSELLKQNEMTAVFVIHGAIMLVLGIFVSGSLLIPLMRETRETVLNLIGVCDVEQLPRKRRIKTKKDEPTASFQMLSPMPRELLEDRLNAALDASVGLCGSLQDGGWRLYQTDQLFAPTILLELQDHPNGCLVKGRLRQHPLLLALWIILAVPPTALTLWLICFRGGFMTAIVPLIPSCLIWTAGALMLSHSSDALRAAVRTYLQP